MLLKGLDIYVYKLGNDGTFNALGEVNKYTSLIWPDKFRGHTTFELNAPVTPENKSLLKEGNIVWCGEENAAIIEAFNVDKNDKGQKVYKVKGRTLEAILHDRIIWGTYNCVNKYASTAMYEIVMDQCVNPTDGVRKIPFLECAEDDEIGKRIYFQKTGGEVYDALESISTEANLGFDILFRPKEKKLIFKVTEGVDRTNLTSPDAVIFSTDLEDILTSSYYKNIQDKKTVAFVAGEGEGSERVKIISGNNASAGFLRKEVYVDARDLQSEVSNSDGTTSTVNPDDYRDMLNDRGMEKLAEHTEVESFEATMRVIGDIQYVYGVDYNKGDKVVVQDTDIGIQVVAVVSEATKNYDDEYELVITFGYEHPSLIQKIKRQIL